MYLNKIDFYNLNVIKTNKISMNIERLVNSPNSKDRNSIFSSTDIRENVIYLEDKYKAIDFSICKMNKMIILRNDNNLIFFPDITNDKHSEIVISQSTSLG